MFQKVPLYCFNKSKILIEKKRRIFSLKGFQENLSFYGGICNQSVMYLVLMFTENMGGINQDNDSPTEIDMVESKKQEI